MGFAVGYASPPPYHCEARIWNVNTGWMLLRDEIGQTVATRQEVEDRFGISKRYLEIAVARNVGPKRIHIGRLVRYRVRDIRDWIDNCVVHTNSDHGVAKL